MSVGPHTQKDEIEDGESCRIFANEMLNELVLVLLCELLEINGCLFEEAIGDRMDVFFRDRNFGIKLSFGEVVVRIGVIGWDNAFIDIKNVPKIANTFTSDFTFYYLDH